MRWLPYEIIILTIPHSPEVAATKLSTILEPKKYLRLGRKHTIFEGEVHSNEFHIQRIIDYRNSFLPKIDGYFAATSEGTRIEITWMMSPWVSTFMIFCFGFIVFFEIGILFGVLRQGASIFFLLTGPAFATFFYLMITACFWPEVAKAKEHLQRVWNENDQTPVPTETTSTQIH